MRKGVKRDYLDLYSFHNQEMCWTNFIHGAAAITYELIKSAPYFPFIWPQSSWSEGLKQLTSHTDTTWPHSQQLHQGVPSWQKRKIRILASLPLGKAQSTLRKKRKRKVGADPWNIFLIIIPPIFCFILSGKHSPLAAMHTIPHLLWAKRNELETGELSQRVVACDLGMQQLLAA